MKRRISEGHFEFKFGVMKQNTQVSFGKEEALLLQADQESHD